MRRAVEQRVGMYPAGTFPAIEQRTTRMINGIFVSLVVFYFIVAQMAWVIARAIIFSPLIPFHAPGSGRGVSSELVSLEIIVAVLALMIALIHWNISTMNMTRKIVVALGASTPDPNDSYHTVFKDVVEEIGLAAGSIPMRAYVIPAAASNAFALSDLNGDAVIGVTEGALWKLSRAQLEAVVAHEAAHIVSRDTLVTTIICSLFGVYSAVFSKLGRAFMVTRSIPLFFYACVISAVVFVASKINRLLFLFLSREMEYRADATAVRFTRDPLALAEALYSIGRTWRGSGIIADELSPLFIVAPGDISLEESEGFFADLFGTHPPLTKRIDALLAMAHADVAALEDNIRTVSVASPQEEKRPDEPGVMPREWFIFAERTWRGPYTADELLTSGIRPTSWVYQRSTDGVTRVAKNKFLNRLLTPENSVIKPLTGGGWICPVCDQLLEEASYKGTHLRSCFLCKGHLVPRSVVMRLLIREDGVFPEQIKQLARAVTRKYTRDILEKVPVHIVYQLKCPICGEPMRRGFYSLGYPVDVDTCDRCELVWFDAYELEVLQCIYTCSNSL